MNLLLGPRAGAWTRGRVFQYEAVFRICRQTPFRVTKRQVGSIVPPGTLSRQTVTPGNPADLRRTWNRWNDYGRRRVMSDRSAEGPGAQPGLGREQSRPAPERAGPSIFGLPARNRTVLLRLIGYLDFLLHVGPGSDSTVRDPRGTSIAGRERPFAGHLARGRFRLTNRL